MADSERSPKGLPEGAPSRQVLASQVDDLLAAIRGELPEGDEEEALGGVLPRERLDSRPSIPDILAQAIVFGEPASLVDSWARGEEGRVEPATIAPGQDESDEEAPATLRPSAMSLPAYVRLPARRRSPWWLAAIAPALGALALASSWPSPARSRLASQMTESARSVVEAAPAPAAPTTGRLALSLHEEAQLIIDGEAADSGGQAIDLPPGAHTIRIEAPGYEPHEQVVTITAGGLLELGEVALTAKPHQLIIDISPANAYVMITKTGGLGDRRYAGPWPRIVALPPGAYSVVGFRQGYETQQRAVTVRAGSEATAIRLALVPDDIYR